MIDSLQLFDLAIGVMLSAVGAWLLVGPNRVLTVHRRCQRWLPVPGRVIRSSPVEEVDLDGPAYHLEFAFEYVYSGRRHRSIRHTDGTSFSDRWSSIRRIARLFPVGAEVTVRVDPGDASSGIVDTGYPQAFAVIRRVGAVAMVLGVTMISCGALRS